MFGHDGRDMRPRTTVWTVVQIASVYIVFKAVIISAIKDVQVSVPRAVRAGHSVTLSCDYDLEGSALYSVKWYHGDEEFYRFVPKEEPPTRVFDLPGIHVDMTVSNAKEVTLTNLIPAISGVYKCEVSADAPSFHTVIKTSVMTVVEIPLGIPTVTVDRVRFVQGGSLIADCVAPPSAPAANLTWFVNDQRVPGSTATSILKHTDLLETATSRLELTGTGNSAPGPIRLRCEASLFKIHKVTSGEMEVKADTPPQPASVLGYSLSGTSSSSSAVKVSSSLGALLILGYSIKSNFIRS